ncbi:hypothetical protein NKH18_35830 [Streptomyces sp. M10(2022)]
MSFTPSGFKKTVTPREMTTADIENTIADFEAASANARRAGFDGVEVHAIGAFLIPQFLNPQLNHRSDSYGKDRAGRRRLLLEIVDAAAAAWDGRCVGVRLSPYWTGEFFTTDDETLADYDELVTELSHRPVAYLHLRGPAQAAPGDTPTSKPSRATGDGSTAPDREPRFRSRVRERSHRGWGRRRGVVRYPLHRQPRPRHPVRHESRSGERRPRHVLRRRGRRLCRLPVSDYQDGSR